MSFFNSPWKLVNRDVFPLTWMCKRAPCKQLICPLFIIIILSGICKGECGVVQRIDNAGKLLTPQVYITSNYNLLILVYKPGTGKVMTFPRKIQPYTWQKVCSRKTTSKNTNSILMLCCLKRWVWNTVYVCYSKLLYLYFELCFKLNFCVCVYLELCFKMNSLSKCV